MQQIGLYYEESVCGAASLHGEGNRVEITAQMRDPGDGLYRAVLMGERGELPLGVMEAENGSLVLRRRPDRSALTSLGALRGVRVFRAFAFRRKNEWNETARPAQLFESEFLKERTETLPLAWWRRTGERLIVALPLRDNMPFPLEALFCFARIGTVEGCPCAIYAFDRQEIPVLGIFSEKTLPI